MCYNTKLVKYSANENRQTKNVDIISLWIYHLLIQKIVHIVSLSLKQKSSDCLGLTQRDWK